MRRINGDMNISMLCVCVQMPSIPLVSERKSLTLQIQCKIFEFERFLLIDFRSKMGQIPSLGFRALNRYE